MTKREQLEKDVVDAEDAAAAADYAAAAADYAAYAAWKQAKRELNEYLKEQDNA